VDRAVQSDDLLSMAVPPGFTQRLREKHPDIFEGKKTIFENLKGSLTIDKGRVHSRDAFLTARGFDLHADGWVGFDQQMDFKTTFVISKAMTDEILREIPLVKHALNSEGRIEVPLIISGRTTAPVYGWDTNATWDRVMDNVLKDAGGKLGDKLKDLFKKD